MKSTATMISSCRVVLGAVGSTLLAGCGSPSLTDRLPAGCAPDNLLENPGFQSEGGYALEGWKGSQHAGEPSFEVVVEDGGVTVTRTGTQPWYTLEQLIPVEQVQGDDLLFRTELKLALDAEGWKPAMDPGGGVLVTVWGPPAPLIGGARIVYRSDMEQEPRLGETDWFWVDIPFQVVEDASRVSVGYHQRASGSMSFRNPGLFRCNAAAADESNGVTAPASE